MQQKASRFWWLNTWSKKMTEDVSFLTISGWGQALVFAILSQLILWYKTRRFSELRNHKVEFGATTAARKCRTTLRKESWKEKVQILYINSSVDYWTLEVQHRLQEVQLRIKNGSEIKLPLRSQSLLLKFSQ